MRHAVVLLKQILDPELPAARFRVDESGRRPEAALAPELLGPFEQSALELALQLRDSGAVERVTAVAAGPPSAVDGLRKALSVRADGALFVRVPEGEELDAAQTAELLSRAVLRLDAVDVVLAGRQAGDWDQGQVGALVAERLGWPCVGLVMRAAAADGRLLVERGEDVLSVAPPAVLTVTNADGNRLRMAKVLDLLASGKQPVEELSPDDLGVGGAELSELRAVAVLRLEASSQQRICELIEGEDARAVAAALVARLAERKVLA